MSEAVAKFHVENVSPLPGAPPEYGGRLVVLWAGSDPSLPEDRRLFDGTASGRLEVHVTSPDALTLFLTEDGGPARGRVLYLTLSTERPE